MTLKINDVELIQGVCHKHERADKNERQYFLHRRIRKRIRLPYQQIPKGFSNGTFTIPSVIKVRWFMGEPKASSIQIFPKITNDQIWQFDLLLIISLI
jgi:hypothetical protein